MRQVNTKIGSIVFSVEKYFLKSFFLRRRGKRGKRGKMMILLRNLCHTLAHLPHFNADRARFLVLKKNFPRKKSPRNSDYVEGAGIVYLDNVERVNELYKVTRNDSDDQRATV